ncbi:hypothetical protein KAI68_07450 [bacterium]|nr:hypothetical protein [bacterium]
MYKHTQFGMFVVALLGAAIFFVGYFSGAVDVNRASVLILSVILLCSIILFFKLTVVGNKDFVEIKFGIGLIRKKFYFKEIKSCEVIRNKWWYGYGIRKSPKGWLFNISGLDAVALSMKNGKVYRIGTDEPQKLSEFIQKSITT